MINDFSAKISDVVGFPLRLTMTDDPKFGDYSTSAALSLAKEKGQAPKDLAQDIKNIIEANSTTSALFEKIEIAGPGFINFWLKKDVVVSELKKVTELKDGYGRSDKLSGQKTIVEYTDPNPFKEFHVGHLYTNTVGESVARILESQGAKVWRADYFGDVGMHVAKAIWGLLNMFDTDGLTMEALKEKTLKVRIEYFGKAYALGSSKYEEDEAAKEEMKQLNFLIFKAAQEVVLPEFNEKPQVDYDRFIKEGGKYDYQTVKNTYELGRAWSLEYFESIYARVGMKFDGYYPESRTGEYGYGMILEGLEKGIFERGEGGAVIFPGEKYGLHSRVFINSLNLPTYETKDFGNAVCKYKDFPYEKSVIITGNEINAYFKVVLKALSMQRKELAEATTHIGHGMVRLPEGKMSSRTGKIIRGEWVLDESEKKLSETHEMAEGAKAIVAQGAVKYAFLRQGIGNDIAFDFESSLSFEGNSGPYLQYTAARANSVFKKSSVKEFDNSDCGEEEMEILRYITRYSDILEKASEEYSPSTICTYLYELAQRYNGFYNKNKIIGSDKEQIRVALSLGVYQVIKNGLNLLGILVPEKM